MRASNRWILGTLVGVMGVTLMPISRAASSSIVASFLPFQKAGRVSPGRPQNAIPPSPPHLAVPPSGFNPLVATPTQLARYGFPPRPKGGKALAEWQWAMQHAKKWVPPNPQPGA